LLSASGSILSPAVNAPGDSQVPATTLPAGTYYIVASSVPDGVIGNYTLSVDLKKVRGQITSQ
jgi:hypothetical protein